jgi:hypothetical protein
MEFIERLMTRQDLATYKTEIEIFIERSGCVKVIFEDLDPKCGGISTPDECIISTIILQFPKEILLYILFHEIAHQYQYKKWGKNLMMDTYTKLPIEDAVKSLLYIESVADRLAILKLRSIIGVENIPPYRYYGCENLEFFKEYISNLRNSIDESNATDIESINEIIYFKYKIK